MLTSILDAMDRDGQRLSNIERDAIGSLERVSFSVNTTKRRHELLSHYLKAEPSIDAVKTFRDPEAD
jgi:putative Mg2+ transporter-C (MgtC) family protein